MKVKVSSLRKIIGEEFKKLRESGLIPEEDGSEKKDPKDKEEKPEKKDSSKEPKKGDAEKGKEKKSSPKAPAKPPQEDPEDLPIDDEPADQELEDETGPEEEEGEKKKAKSRISSELVGKSIQSISMDPQSKVLPGAQEIVLTFDQVPDALRILVTKTGKVAFYYRGLHNEL